MNSLIPELRRNSMAFELSNDDFSVDLIHNFDNESSLNTEKLDLERKLSTVTFGPKDSKDIVQKRKKRKNKKRHHHKKG